MNQPNPAQSSNVLPLPKRRGSTERTRATSQRVAQLRQHLSLLQGYAELMEGLSPGQQAHVLRVMAEKTRELTTLLAPFTAPERADRPAIENYRQARQRSRQLLADYRRLLDHLHEIIEPAPGSSA